MNKLEEDFKTVEKEEEDEENPILKSHLKFISTILGRVEFSMLS